MTSINLSRKQLNFAQISIVCVDILKQCLIDILDIHIKPTDLGKEIRLSPSLTAGKDKLSSEQKDLCCPLSPGVPDYGKFDVTLLYKLIRNLCPKLKPSKEWGKEPDTADQKIGDDIERIRLFRNKHYAHPNSAEITESDFTDLWNEGKSLIHRIQIFTTAKGCKTDYGLKLTNISGRMIKYEEYTSYVNLFRAIYIERNVEVTCGDTAHFKADIRLEESAFLSVSWERVDGSARKHIDISCEKYKGSTSRQLNIHSVCKEDEGEYQAVISRNIDHKIFSNIGFLRTQGELPRLDNLKVSTTKEEICIHYSHTVLENSPRVTDIEWTKNMTPLDLTDHKYCGGGLENSCLTISCPTKEDGGEYSCTVTNAVGSVSRVVILEEPSAKISTNTPVVHGSETRFSCLISSCPSSEEIEWQKSCDGNTFYPIDINELKYHGSNEDPSSPVLCLPKTTFDDQQFYRIAVRNKIGECMSSTHFLEVVGNRPNITNAICTTKDRSVRLNCDVFLYDKSPPLQEVYWTKNEHRLDVHGSGGKYSGRVSPDDRSLTINNVNKHDAGNYQLTAINSVGPTYSDVIVLGVPDVVLKKKYKNEDGSQCFMITIKSNPAPFFVQWSMKDKKSGTLQQINLNADEYKGTSNSFPRPMLVVKHKETLENYRFRIEVENVIGFTEKVIPDETSPIPLKSDDNTVNVGNLNRVYEKRGRNIRFGKVFDELAEKFPEAKIGRLKDLIQNSCEVEDVRSLKQAKSARDCFRILRSENIFTPEDVICLQYLLKMTECEELERKCIEYAKMQKALYYYEKPPDNGYMNVHFHIVANIRGYGTENITKVRETVAAIVGCTIEEVLVNGYLPSASFILVLSIKNNLVNKLLALKRKDEDKLSKLSIDYFKIGGTTIRLEFLRDQDEHTTVYPYPESSGLSEMPYFSDYDFMESGSDQDEHTTLYPYPESSGLSEMPYFSDYDFMESVYGESGSGWMMNRLKDGSKFYFNTNTKEYKWSRPDGVVKDHGQLNKEEIQRVVSDVTAAHDRELLFQANENLIVKIQANYRGYQARKAYKERLDFMKRQLPLIIKIQSKWKMVLQKNKYRERLKYMKDNESAAVKLQAQVRGWKARKEYQGRKKFFNDHLAVIIKLQSYFRTNKARHDYVTLMNNANPPLPVVQRFVHLLDFSDVDYAEEIELQKIRQKVVSEIKSTKQLEDDLDQMDIKIGLLIKNRVTLQDVVTHGKKLSKHREDGHNMPKGLKGLSKACHDRLEAYQHLFYLLQTNPLYLAKLIFEMPQNKMTKFMEAVIYSLFNYGANQREEFLLLKLFRKALEEEIESKVDKMSDFVTGNPLVVKMIVGFNRNQRGQNSLREMLNPLIIEVIEDKNLRINTNPVEVYKAWVNQTETSTGVTSGLPYDVTTEQALKHDEVKAVLAESITRLTEVTDKFLNAIFTSLDKIPYGMRYMAKVLKAALEKKFPEAAEKDVLKIVGNLLYYRYINSAIVAPDAFDIINVEADKQLSNDQRRNLGSVAKILQFAASNKGFGGDSSYLAAMNDYIRQSHEKFKKYCVEACDVPEPEDFFHIDQYSDIVTIAKPSIYISVQEIIDTHQLLLHHEDQIAPDPQDPIHKLLEDLREVPSVDELLGTDLPEDEEMRKMLQTQLGKTEISLTLSNKFEVPEDDQADVQQLLVRTKRLVVDVIACQTGDNLLQILDSPASEEQEELHQSLVKKRDERDHKAKIDSEGGLMRQQSMSGDTRMPLSMMKTKVKKNLQNLELHEVVTRKNGYQDLVNMIAQDIRNQRNYRNSRKHELMRVRETVRSLQEKRMFYESQIDYYNRYVQKCIENLQQRGNNRKSRGIFRRDASQKVHFESLKYSAAKLHEKGIILEIGTLPTNQFKNMQFEIKETADPGVFEVQAKLLGMEVKKIDLVFQDLLQLQYEGVAVIELFNDAKVNVNLLIFLLNKKFYSAGK